MPGVLAISNTGISHSSRDVPIGPDSLQCDAKHNGEISSICYR